MTESFVIKTISAKTSKLPPSQATEIHERILSLLKEKNHSGIMYYLRENELMDDTLSRYFDCALNNGMSDQNLTSQTTDFDEVLFEALLPKFDAPQGKVFGGLQPLNGELISFEEATTVAKEIFRHRMEEGKVVLPFIIPVPTEPMKGVVATRLYSTPKKIRLVEVWSKIVPNCPEPTYLIKFLGENVEKRGGNISKTEWHYSVPFWVYKFEGDSDGSFILLSRDKVQPGPVRVWGSKVMLRDASGIGDALNLPNDLVMICAVRVEPDEPKVDEALFWECASLWGHEELAKGYFTIYRHPPWFEKLLLSWMFAGKYDRFPLHLAWVSKPGCGKTSILNAMQDLFKEPQGLFNGANSTFKDLVPSFGGKLPKPGYLAKTKRVAMVDEFLTSVLRSASSPGSLSSSDELGQLTTLLDHSIGLVGSGKHESVEIGVRGKVLMVTNPKSSLRNMADLCGAVNNAFISRLLWYFMTEQHREYIKKNMAQVSCASVGLEEKDRSIFLMAFDYLNFKTLKTDYERVQEIADRVKEIVPSVAYPVYDARALHHINCLVDGVAKYNSIVKKRGQLTVCDEDYTEAEALLVEVVSTWQDSLSDITSMPVKLRKSHIPVVDRELFDFIERAASVTKEEIGIAFPVLKEKNTLGYHLSKLEGYGLVRLVGDKYFVWWHRDLQALDEFSSGSAGGC